MDVLRQQMRFVRSAVDPDAIHSSRAAPELEDMSSTFTSGSATVVIPVKQTTANGNISAGPSFLASNSFI